VKNETSREPPRDIPREEDTEAGEDMFKRDLEFVDKMYSPDTWPNGKDWADSVAELGNSALTEHKEGSRKSRRVKKDV
jgi:thiamine kinase-like enzyme